MTRKDFDLIARVVREWETDEANRRRLAEIFVTKLRPTNALFNPSRFLEACGVEG